MHILVTAKVDVVEMVLGVSFVVYYILFGGGLVCC